MDRRDFLKTGSAAAASALVPEAFSQNSAGAETGAAHGGRIILPINRNWRYSATNSEAAHGKDFDDSRFDQVVIPHTNVTAALAQLRRQVVRIYLYLPAPFQAAQEARGKRVFVDFEASDDRLDGLDQRDPPG